MFGMLEKLKIIPDPKKFMDKPFEVMFNPETYSMTYENEFENCQVPNSSGKEQKFLRTKPKNLTLDIILDNTGVAGYGAGGIGAVIAAKRLMDISGKKYGVYERVKKFLKMTVSMDGKMHRPKKLRVKWGKSLDFECYAKKVDVKYTLFDNNGDPLRATLTVTFVSTIDDKKRIKKEGKSSPDLTHIRAVETEDTLPSMAYRIYKNPSYYIHLATVNKLDNFRKLKTGAQLSFPPVKD